jgi:hypothetical protein
MPISFTQLRGFVCPALLCAAFLATAASPESRAAHTRAWVQTDYEDFEKGVLKNLSLRSDGRLTLAPRSEERFDSTSAYLWALAQDSKGNLFTGGGPGAKLYRISPAGEKKQLAEFEALEIHAIAVDNKDRVFAATSPDGKIYRVAADGKSEVFYDPKSKYIWAMVFNPQGDLFVATGDHGEVHRVAPDGKGKVFFKSDETHVRSLTLDRKGNLIAGTDPGGLVLRISPAGEGFVLYDMAKREITAVAVAKDGSIYAAGVGSPTPAPPVPAPPPVPAAVPPAPAMNPNQPRAAAAAPPSLVPSGATPIAGGSEVYRIHPDGHPQKVFSAAQEIVYAIGFETQGRALIGTGNKGYVYRLDSDGLYTAWLNVGPTQVTAFAPGRDGKIYAATGNVGKVYEIGPGPAAEGSIESDVFDASLFSLWGRVSFKGSLHGGHIAIRTRSGNLDRPEKNWSVWSDPISSADGARTTSPAARFFQWKATLSSASRSPELDAVEVAYLARNVAPRIEEIEVTPANYRFPTPALPAGPSQTLSLPPLGKRARSGSSISLDTGVTPSLQYAKGAIGARWNAIDENGDGMIYSVHIRGVKESEWKLLKEKVRERYLSWDSTAFPDGEYQVRVTASDLPGNTKEDALDASLESNPFLIDNTPPRISGLTAAPAGRKLAIRWKAADALSIISKAEYSIDGGEWTLVTPVGKLSDSLALDYELTLDDVTPGEHTIAVRVEDEYANQATDKVVVK